MCIKGLRLVTMQLPEKFLPIGVGTNRSSHIRLSAQSSNLNTCNYLIIPNDRSLPSGVARLSGWGYAGGHRQYIVGPVSMPPWKMPHREQGEDSLGDTRGEPQ
jgi:hypothetical protein